MSEDFSSDSPPPKPAGEWPPPNVPNYELLRRIGRGSYGEVWLARNIMGEFHAVKAVHRQALGGNEEHYQREIKAIQVYAPISRTHESLVPVLYSGQDDATGCFYYVMELADAAKPGVESQVEGEGPTPEDGAAPSENANFDWKAYVPRTLQYELKRHSRLPLGKCIEIGAALTMGLERLHQNKLIHRDIKPANVIFVHGRAKLADIGLVTDSKASASFVGTLGYIAPEGPNGNPADIYALGKVLYEMATGKDRISFPELPSFAGLDEREQQGLRDLNLIFSKACEPDPNRRYRTATEMRNDLLLLQAGASILQQRAKERTLFRLKAAVKWSVPVALVLAAWFGVRVYKELAVEAERRKSMTLREVDRRRESLIRKAETLRVGVRSHGWFTNSWRSLSQAAGIRSGNDVLEQAAAALAGLDADVIAGFTNLGGSSLAFDISGRLLIGGLTNHPAQVWSPAPPTGLEALSVTGDGPVRFMSDATGLQFVPHTPGRFALREVRSGRVRREFALAGDTATGYDGLPVLALSPDSSRVAVAVRLRDGSGAFAVWDAMTGKELGRGTEAVTALAFSPDSACLATGDAEGVAVLRSLPGLSGVARLASGRAAIRCLAFAPDLLTPYAANSGDDRKRFPWLLAAGDGGGTIWIWEIARKRERAKLIGSRYDVFSVAFNPDGTLLASAGRDEVRLWDVATGQPLLNIAAPAGFSVNYVRAVAFSPGGDRFATVGGTMFVPPALVVLKLDAGRGIATLRGLRSQVGRVWWAADGKRVAALSHDWSLGVWDVPSGRLLRVFEVPKGEIADNAAVAFFTDDRRIAYTSGAEARIFDLESGETITSLPLTLGFADHLRFVDEGRLLLLRREARPGEQGARTWQMRNLLGSEPGRIVFEQDINWWAYNMVLPPKGDRFFVWNRRGQNGETASTIRAYGLDDGQERWHKAIQTLEADVVCDPAGEHGAFLTGDGSYHTLFRLSDGELVPGTNRHHVHAMYSGRKYFATSGDSSGGCLFFALELPPEGVRLAKDWRMGWQSEFSPDGSRLAWGTEDGLVLVADLDEVLLRLRRFDNPSYE